ncbi:glycerophosphodiester phosphodiesterase [Saliphagus sp. LR7]|uniref:glycerophosphodiester phosphodiesterase n=1 Tax=Saliphagus sp. LR7 TaxID=2282654 RepID=UPI000DF7FE50|nr:glycerophosphodiester phosphodiesterase [Saliphagus sp. LR7]
MAAVIAHRGFAGSAPENTVAALAGAIEAGADAVELDVRPAACGTPVVFHDDRLEGDEPRDGRPLTDREGLVCDQPLERVRGAEVLESGRTVPTLVEVLEALPSTAGVNVELKSPGTPDRRPGEALSAGERGERRRLWAPFVERVLADCRGFEGDLLFSSFCEGALAALRAAGGGEAAVLPGPDLEAGLEVARRYDCEAIHPPIAAVVGTPSTADLVAVAHEEGRAVNAWTATSWLQFDDLERAGVDGVIAEYPGLGGWS